MDAYCSKPFEPTELLRTIETFLTRRGVTCAPEAAPIPPDIQPVEAAAAPDLQAPPLDVSVLLRRCSGKPSLALTILNKFEKQVAAAVADLERLHESSQTEPLARASHALKGTAGVVAAEPLRLAAGALEELARAGAMADSNECLQRLKAEVDRCLAHVATAREQLSAATVRPGGGAPCVS